MRDSGKKLTKYGIRLDSGDLAYLSKEARKMLDAAGFETAVIAASNDLDEYLLHDLKVQGAAITSWGVGTNLITSKDCPSFGGVYTAGRRRRLCGKRRSVCFTLTTSMWICLTSCILLRRNY